MTVGDLRARRPRLRSADLVLDTWTVLAGDRHRWMPALAAIAIGIAGINAISAISSAGRAAVQAEFDARRADDVTLTRKSQDGTAPDDAEPRRVPGVEAAGTRVALARQRVSLLPSVAGGRAGSGFDDLEVHQVTPGAAEMLITPRPPGWLAGSDGVVLIGQGVLERLDRDTAPPVVWLNGESLTVAGVVESGGARPSLRDGLVMVRESGDLAVAAVGSAPMGGAAAAGGAAATGGARR